MKQHQQHQTILDLAAALKLSAATVSRALNNTSYVKEDTKLRVLEMAEKLGYRKNTMAAGLRNNKTNTVGLIVPKISMYFHSAVVTVIQNLLHAQGYNLIIGQSNDDPGMEKELVDTLFSSRVDALIVSCTLQTEDFNHFNIFTDHNIPVLFYDRVPPRSFPSDTIKGDDFRGGYLAGKHLAETGCKQIALISGPLTSNLYQDRSAGFFSALEQHKIEIYRKLTFHQPLTADYTRAALRKMFAGEVIPDALFVTSDRNAVTALQFAKENGINVPDDLRIVGYSNDPITAIVSPSITSVEQFPAVFGDRLVQALMEMLKVKATTRVYTDPIITPVELIRRMST
jgi:DNA-binding LacI/PurR family transcriptional regulator